MGGDGHTHHYVYMLVKSVFVLTALFIVIVGCNRSSAPPASIDEPVDAAWRSILFGQANALSNVPTIVSTTADGDDIRVTIKNDGDTTLQYYSAGPAGIQLFQEIQQSGEWKQASWDWCGTGKEQFEIEPGETVELIVDFWDEDSRERMLAIFTERGTDRMGLVVLAAEDDSAG